MSAGDPVDLGGYPVLRMDQVPSIESDVLRRAEVDVRELLQSSSSDADPPKIVFYLQKQLDAMKNELAHRAANERIQLLLSDALHDTAVSAAASSSSRVPRGARGEHGSRRGGADSPSGSSVKTSLSAGTTLLRGRTVTSAPTPSQLVTIPSLTVTIPESGISSGGDVSSAGRDTSRGSTDMEKRAPAKFTPLPLPSELHSSSVCSTRPHGATPAAAGEGSADEGTSAAPAARPRRRPSSGDSGYKPSSRSLGETQCNLPHSSQSIAYCTFLK